MPADEYERGRWRNFGGDYAYIPMGAAVSVPVLHPDTEPGAVAAAQRAAVAEFRGLAAAEISELAVLPVSVVLRRLAELEST
jgi:hypothetical protein